MKLNLHLRVSTFLLALAVTLSFAANMPADVQKDIHVSPGEMAEAVLYWKNWFDSNSHTQDKSSPFSFIYDGKPCGELISKWELKRESLELDAGRIQNTIIYTDVKTGLEVRCVAIKYSDFPVIEWTVFFRNTGNSDTPILQNIQALDICLKREQGEEFMLRGISGDDCSPNSFEPYEHTLAPKVNKHFTAVRGRPTQQTFPYYNLAMPGGGMILAMGWPGQWATSFARDSDSGLQITAGQELTHLSLKPGEEIRTPLMAVLFWKGSDVVRSQNLWRRWMLEHNLPKPGNEPLSHIFSFCIGGLFGPTLKTNESSEKQFIDALVKQNIKIDYWWMDAGWYPCSTWTAVGTWEPDKERFPDGIKAISDYVHAKGMKLIVWFEPESVIPGTWLAKNHPEWIFGGEKGGLLNLGNPAAREWLTNHVDKLISEEGIDLYRQDFNRDPLLPWRDSDASNRQGMAENLHVQGYLAYWDELLRRHPGMLIDSCASGGRRIDLETLRRAVPLLRSDYQSSDPSFAIGNQGHTFGLSFWLPYYGTGVYFNASQFSYLVNSYMCPAFAIIVDVRHNDIPWDQYRRLVEQWRDVASCFLGDYYPLTPYNLQKDKWIAWQFNRPEQADGMVHAFRRENNNETKKTFYLFGLDPDAIYLVANLTTGKSEKATGRVLMEQGLKIEIPTKPEAALIKYCIVPSGLEKSPSYIKKMALEKLGKLHKYIATFH